MSLRTPILRSLLVLGLATACSSDGDSGTKEGSDDGGSDGAAGQPRGAALFDAAITTVVLEVDHVPGAAPYTGALGAGMGDTWDLFHANADALFAGEKTLDIPTTLDEMEEIPSPGAGPYSASAILDIADAHRDQLSSGATATFYAVWLDGYYEAEGEAQEGVIGVSIGDTGVVAMFKPVIEGLGAVEGVRRFSEQTTLIHEFGHAIGLVENGIPAISDHHDAEHGAHCSDNRCVMYWANEGTAEVVQFVTEVMSTGDTVIFGADCLADVAAVRGD